MQIPVLSSTALLTGLMSVGLVFFIRASTKDRIQVVKLVADRSRESLSEQLRQYFNQRAYRVTAVNESANQVTFEGLVRPSVFLAIFLTAMAAIGLLCLALMLSFPFPAAAKVLPGLTVLAPIAGVFYWKKSARPEQVVLQVDAGSGAVSADSVVTVTAHRDELAELQRSLALKSFE